MARRRRFPGSKEIWCVTKSILNVAGPYLSSDQAILRETLYLAAREFKKKTLALNREIKEADAEASIALKSKAIEVETKEEEMVGD
jgi:hypothetical protein